MVKYIVLAPNKEYYGTSHGVDFVQGKGSTDDDWKAEMLDCSGYDVELSPEYIADLEEKQKAAEIVRVAAEEEAAEKAAAENAAAAAKEQATGAAPAADPSTPEKPKTKK